MGDYFLFETLQIYGVKVFSASNIAEVWGIERTGYEVFQLYVWKR